MVSKEEQELIDLRMKWADMPILNFWHDTNDAPDTFFDELLDESRGDVTTETKAKRTTTPVKRKKRLPVLMMVPVLVVQKSSIKSPTKVGVSSGSM
jgi:hypothetical protein